jgi:hypothetical protein
MWQPDLPKSKMLIQTGAGFFGWYLVNGLLWQIPDLRCVLFPANVLLLLALLRFRLGGIAQGILIAWISNLLFALVAGTFLDALLLVPFFIKL